ncbi:MAG: FKBP-type peptidyl-prolyl cis-trans isomerase [Bacteroidetes bacterium]|nr:FKBP-type peptidyl-prolyl cis-trans isomerase [Bacteroidota bacterium]
MSISDKLRAMREEKAAANLEAGKKFLAENAQREGVVSLDSGLQYEILVEGTGPKPGPTSSVTCHYHGTLPNGTVFDSSVRRGQPATFPLNRVIKGWTEALQLMPTGSKWRLYLPPHLAYGEQQVSAEIGPNSTLVFEVELLGVA